MNLIKFIKDEKGAAGLEFTLVFPFLLFVTFGIIEFGSFMFDKAIITNAAREGARAAIAYTYEGTGIPDCTILATDIRPKVVNLVDRYMHDNLGNGNYFLINFDPDEEPTVIVDPPELVVLPDGTVGTEYVIPVRVGYTFQFIFIDNIINLILSGAAGEGIYLEAEARMRGEDNYRIDEDTTVPLLEFIAPTC